MTLVKHYTPVSQRGQYRVVNRSSTRRSRVKGKRLYDAHPMTLRRKSTRDISLPDSIELPTFDIQFNIDAHDVTDNHECTVVKNNSNPRESSQSGLDVMHDQAHVSVSDRHSDPADNRRSSGGSDWPHVTELQRHAARGITSLPNLRGDRYNQTYQKIVDELQRDNDFTTSVLRQFSEQRRVQEFSRQPSVESHQRASSRGSRTEQLPSRPTSAADEVKSLADSVRRLIMTYPAPADVRDRSTTFPASTQRSKSCSRFINNSSGNTLMFSPSKVRFDDEDVEQPSPPPYVRMQIPTFDGTDYPVFKRLFDTYAQVHMWDDDTRLVALYSSLRGDAKNLLVLLRDDKVTYTDVCNILEAKYGANRSYTDVVETLTFMCSKQYADLHDFVVEIKRQVRRTDLGQEASRRLVRQTFVAGLADRAQRAYVNRKDVAKDDVMTALHYASEYERRWTAISNVTSPSTQKAAARATPSEDTREVNTVKQFIDNKEAAWQLKIDKLEVQNELLRSSLTTLRQRLDDVQKRQEQTTRPVNGNSYDGYNSRQDTRFRRRGQRGNHGRTVRFDLREQECHSDARQQQQTVSQVPYYYHPPPQSIPWNQRATHPAALSQMVIQM